MPAAKTLPLKTKKTLTLLGKTRPGIIDVMKCLLRELGRRLVLTFLTKVQHSRSVK